MGRNVEQLSRKTTSASLCLHMVNRSCASGDDDDFPLQVAHIVHLSVFWYQEALLILQIGVTEGDLLLPCWGIGQGGGNEIDVAFQQRGNTPVGCHRHERHGVGVTETASGKL